MEESGGKLRGTEDSLHVFNEKTEPLGFVHILPVKGLSEEPDMQRTLLTPLAFLHDTFLGRQERSNLLS